jgi:hypothetical protein
MQLHFFLKFIRDKNINLSRESILNSIIVLKVTSIKFPIPNYLRDPWYYTETVAIYQSRQASEQNQNKWRLHFHPSVECGGWKVVASCLSDLFRLIFNLES